VVESSWGRRERDERWFGEGDVDRGIERETKRDAIEGSAGGIFTRDRVRYQV
jgi:hypothetical protein